MRIFFVSLFLLALSSCEQVESDLHLEEKSECNLSQNQFTFDYEGCKVYGRLELVSDSFVRKPNNQKVYDLIIESPNLKKNIITQLVKNVNADGSFVYEHYFEGIKVATLFYDVSGQLYDITVENIPTTRLAKNFLKCFNQKYSDLKKQFQDNAGEFVTDMTISILAPGLAATAAADCAGVFDYTGIM